MPAFFAALLLVVESVCIELVRLLGRNDADLVVVSAKFPAAIRNRMDVESRSGGLSRELAQPLGQLLLEIVAEIVLLSEEYNASSRDWS